MARWSSANNSSCSYTDVKIDVFDECEERLKILFDQALLIFLEEEDNNNNHNNKPLPAILGDGVRVDLFKLFVLVRERQGFDSVSRKGLWESVAVQLGLDCSVSPSLRLLYSKYLDRMEKWAMEKSRIVNWDNKESEKKGCFGGMLHELGDGLKGLLENGKCGKRNRAMVSGCKHVEESGSSELHRFRKRFRESSSDDDDDEEFEVSSVGPSGDSDSDEEEEGLEVSSKKKEDLPEMLKWLTSVAKCPHDPSIGVIPHWSKWKQYTGNECWIQVTRARKALLVQRGDVQSRCQNAPLLGHQIMHPSMYENDRKSTGRLRCSIQHPHLSKPSSISSCNGSLASLTKPGSNGCRELITACKSTTAERRDLMAGTSGVTDLPEYLNAITEPNRRYVAVGRNFQAQVDEWTGSGLDSDTKWLGTCTWPLETEESLEQTLGKDMIGKGRPDSCSCDTFLSGSVECIRFHIAEKRMQLKRDLGDVFFHWRFNQMGEEVSLRWTEREEKRFKDMMITDPENFWGNAAKRFRGKKREQIVSYYFNVFLINRRRYQNRVTPRDIDSDDEGPFGSVGNSFGGDAVASLGSDIMICSQNNQCHDYD